MSVWKKSASVIASESARIVTVFLRASRALRSPRVCTVWPRCRQPQLPRLLEMFGLRAVLLLPAIHVPVWPPPWPHRQRCLLRSLPLARYGSFFGPPLRQDRRLLQKVLHPVQGIRDTLIWGPLWCGWFRDRSFVPPTLGTAAAHARDKELNNSEVSSRKAASREIIW